MMTFFQIEVVVSVAVALYVAFYFRAARRFLRENRSVLERGMPIMKTPIRHVARFFIFCCYVACGPLVQHWLNQRDFMAEQERLERDRKFRAEQEAARQAESKRRADFRREWLEKNDIVLYSRTLNGVTTVMTPASYNVCTVLTERARRNGLWESDTVLMPTENRFLFCNKKGMDVLKSVLGTSDPIGSCQISGWLTDLDDMMAQFGVKIELKADIFVPHVSNAILPLAEHLTNRNSHKFVEHLVYNQMPAEIRPN